MTCWVTITSCWAVVKPSLSSKNTFSFSFTGGTAGGSLGRFLGAPWVDSLAKHGSFPFVAASPVLFPGPRKTGIGNGESPSEGGLSRSRITSKQQSNENLNLPLRLCKWSDTSFQDNQQFSQISSCLNTEREREREGERNIQARKEHQEPTPTTWWFVESEWLQFSCFVTLIFNILNGDFQFGRCDAASESAKVRAQCSRWPGIYLCLLGDLKPFQILQHADFHGKIRVLDVVGLKPPWSSKTTPRFAFGREPKMGIHQPDSRTWQFFANRS